MFLLDLPRLRLLIPNLLRGLRRLERLLDLGLELGDSPTGVPAGDDGMGDNWPRELELGRIPRSLGLLAGNDADDDGGGAAAVVSPAVEDTVDVDTMEGGGDGVVERAVDDDEGGASDGVD